MPALLLLLYLVVEIAALVALAAVVGVLWTVVIVVAVWGLGWQLIRAQGRRVLDGLRQAAQGERSPDGAVADGALVAVGSVLMVIPGLVTSVLGALLLLPPTRFVVRPLALLLASRKLGMAGMAASMFARGRGDVIEGEVVESYVDDSYLIKQIEPAEHDPRAMG